MSELEAAAGTGNKTASQAEAVQTAPEQAQPDMSALSPDAASQSAAQPKQEQQQAAGKDDGLQALQPDMPEEAASFAPEKPGEAEDAEGEGAEEAIDVALPDGFTVDEAAMGQFKDALKTAESKQDMAQKLMDIHVGEQRKLLEAVQSKIFADAARQNAEWAQQCRSDPDFGGEKYDESSNYVTKAILDHVPQEERGEFLRVFKALKLNNQPHLRRFLARVGMASAESGPVNSGGNGAPLPKTLAEKMFPHIKE